MRLFKINIVLIYVIATIFPIYGNAQKHKTDWEKYGLKGKVKSFNEAVFDDAEKAGKPLNIDSADEDIHQYEFDSIGHLTRERVFTLGSLRNEEWRYKYSKNGELTDKISYNTKFDKGESYIGEEDSTHFKYDSSGNDIEEDAYYPNGELIVKYLYGCDKAGNRTSEKVEVANGMSHTNFEYKYDQRGNKIEEKWEGECEGCPPQGAKYIYTYNDKNVLIEEKEFKGAFTKNYTDRSVYYYDANGILIATDLYDTNGTLLQKMEYDYMRDKSGNWIKKIEGKKITKREIEYYK